jgi:20S proteasome alpha/beta subunit
VNQVIKVKRNCSSAKSGQIKRSRLSPVVSLILSNKMLSNFVLLILLAGLCQVVHSELGGTFIALTGKDSIVMATDSRFTQNNMMMGKYLRNIHRIGSRMLLGSYGLEADDYSLTSNLKQAMKNHKESELDPENIASLITHHLNNGQFSVCPILAGISKKTGLPSLYSFDSLGAKTESDKFAVSGTSSSSLMALLEKNYVPNLAAVELCGLAENCLRLAFQRDILSGGDIKIVTLCADGVYMKTIPMTDV